MQHLPAGDGFPVVLLRSCGVQQSPATAGPGAQLGSRQRAGRGVDALPGPCARRLCQTASPTHCGERPALL